MSTRFRLAFVLGCGLVLALHAPKCLDALRGKIVLEATPAAMAALDGSDDGAAYVASPRAGANRP